MKKQIATLAAVAMLALGFAPLAFADSTVSATVNGGASVTPPGITVVPTGITQTFLIGADNGYRVTHVVFDGLQIGTPSSFDFTGTALDPAIHTLDVTAEGDGGGGMIYCSGPSAPGWNVGIPGGGCGGTDMFVARGATLFIATPTKNGLAGSGGYNFTCPDFYPSGCMVPTK